MISKKEGNIIFARLFKDENLISGLKEILSEYNVRSGIVLSGIGMLKDITLCYFKGRGIYMPELISDPHELISLTGNFQILEDKTYNIHLHAVVSDETKKAYAGHLQDAKVAVTLELALLVTDIKVMRKYEEETGLMGMYFE